MKNYKDISNEELKEEFIKWFGEEKWNEEEMLFFIDQMLWIVCNEYLGIEPIPVIFEEVPGNISVLDTQLHCIKLNPKYKDDKVILVAAAVHELEHWYQLLYVSNMNTPKATRWKKELDNYISDKNPDMNVLQEIEIDAEAFTEIILDCEFGIKYINPNPILQALIDEYILNHKITSDE